MIGPTLGRKVETGELDANLVMAILDENRLLPYIIGDTRNLHTVSLGQLTNASKIGDIVVSEECIRGTYELCLAFLGFVLTIVRAPNYIDTTKTLLASVTYIANEIYPTKNKYNLITIFQHLNKKVEQAFIQQKCMSTPLSSC